MMAGVIERPIHTLALLGAATLLAGTVSASPGQVDAIARLKNCGADTCLVVTGHRLDRAAPVSVAAHPVVVQGGRSWRVAVPLATVRAWSAPFARTILVEVEGGDGGKADVPLPIGLLGSVTELAFLDVSVGH